MMRFNKELCFFIETPLTPRDYKRFGVEFLLSRGFKVSFLDMTRLLNPLYFSNYNPELSDYKNVFVAQKRSDLFHFLKENSDILGINMVGFTRERLFFYRALKKYNIRYVAAFINSIPLPMFIKSSSNNKVSLIIKKMLTSKLNIKKFNRNFIRDKFIDLIALLPDSVLGLYRPEYILVDGKSYGKRRPNPPKDVKTIWAHTFDYDIYLDFRSQAQERLIKYDYAVFLDEYFPFHPDFFTSSILQNPYHEPSDYYEELNLLLDYVELKMGIPIIIAAHPKSQYENKPDFFRGRRRVKDQTIGLVAFSKFVLCHCSTSINFAVLFEKPIIFLMPDKVKGHHLGKIISSFARELNKVPIASDTIPHIDLSKELVVDKGAYSTYRENYIKTSFLQDIYFWEIFSDALKKEDTYLETSSVQCGSTV